MKPFLLLAVALCFVGASSSAAQELPKARKRANQGFYQAVYYDFKMGRAGEAKRIAREHFRPVNAALNRGEITFEPLSGEWDWIVFFPLAEGTSTLEWEVTPFAEQWNAELAKREGGAAKAQELLTRFSELIERSKTEIVVRREE